MLNQDNQTTPIPFKPMPGWTPDVRELQRQVIHHWKPWTRSSDPNTPGGKQKYSNPPKREITVPFANRPPGFCAT